MSEDGALRSVVPVRDWLGARAVSRLADYDGRFSIRFTGPHGDWAHPVATDETGIPYDPAGKGASGDGRTARGDWGFRPALRDGVQRLGLRSDGSDGLCVDLSLRRLVRQVPRTVRPGDDDELFVTPGHCTFCFEPGRGMCDRCRAEIHATAVAWPLLPDLVVPLAAEVGRALDVDFYVVALESWGPRFTLELAWFGRWPWTLSSQRPPFMRRWLAEDDVGTRYAGQPGGGGGGPDGSSQELLFTSGLDPAASSLTLVMPSPGRDPLITITVDL